MARGYPDYEGGKRGVYSPAEWAAFEGTDINLGFGGIGIAWGGVVTVIHNVPAGMTFYITQLSFHSCANLAADADKNQICFAIIDDVTTGAVHAWLGGNGGGGMSFSKPPVIPASHQARGRLYNRANHGCDLSISIAGYEI